VYTHTGGVRIRLYLSWAAVGGRLRIMATMQKHKNTPSRLSLSQGDSPSLFRYTQGKYRSIVFRVCVDSIHRRVMGGPGLAPALVLNISPAKHHTVGSNKHNLCILYSRYIRGRLLFFLEITRDDHL